MKDAYSFDVDQAGLDRAFEEQRRAYERIFARCGLAVRHGARPTRARWAAAGRPSSWSGPTPARTRRRLPGVRLRGEPRDGRPRRAAPRRADGRRPPAAPRAVRHARRVTIEALEQPPYGVPATRQLKTLVYVADGTPVVAVVRGDHGSTRRSSRPPPARASVRPAHPDEIRAADGRAPGSLGAVGVTAGRRSSSIAPLAARTDMVTGANEDGFHLRGVDVARDSRRTARARRPAHRPGRARAARAATAHLEVFKALEVGHIFKLGTRYSRVDGRDRPRRRGQARCRSSWAATASASSG